MSDYAKMDRRPNTKLPSEFKNGHNLCFAIHDTILQLFVAGLKADAFSVNFAFNGETEKKAFQTSEDILDWIREFRNEHAVADVFVVMVFPAVLGDLLNFVYEALETSRKGKLAVTYALLRKPIQESLFLLEVILLDRLDFKDKLSTEPHRLHSQTAGGAEVHAKRIIDVISLIDEADRFDGAYLSGLRYDKDKQDGFDRLCNLATHLITTHKSIRTQPMNLNFVFSQFEQFYAQWEFLYSRLPYILFYIWRVTEKIFETMDVSDPEYLEHVDRMISAGVLLWWDTVPSEQQEPELEQFVSGTRQRLERHCQLTGSPLTQASLTLMAETGALPGESRRSAKARANRLANIAFANRKP